MALCRHSILSGLSKMLVGEVEKAKLHVVKEVHLTHFLLLVIPNYDFNKVEKVMIKWDAWH